MSSEYGLITSFCSYSGFQIIYLTNRFHVAVRLFSNRSQMTSKCRKNKKVAHEAQSSVSLMFLPHFDVFCDLLLNRRTATWNLFVLCNKKLKYTEKIPFYFKFRHFDRHENSTDVILCLHKMKQTDWLLCLAKNCDWFKFKIQKIQENLNRALSSSMRLSSNRSLARTNQNASITLVII